MNTIWVYPGQGAQQPNMLHRLPAHPLVKFYLEQACDALNQDVLQLDHPQALRSTYAVQLCLYIAGVISAELLKEQQVKPQFVAGMSIGAWAAATSAEVISFKDGLSLVAKRAELMQQAYPTGYGMTAILGTDLNQVEKWITGLGKSTELFIANINSDNQIVVSGTVTAMQILVKHALQNNAWAQNIEISVPSHCILLDKQAKQLAALMQSITTQAPTIAYLSGTSARLLKTDMQIKDDLAYNMSRRIDWQSTMQSAWERGARLQIEALPGNVLTTLAKNTFKEGSVLSFQSSSLEQLITTMKM